MASGASTRDAVAFHAAFAAVALGGLALPAPALGWRLLALVGLYNVALPVVGRLRGHRGWVSLWAFLVPLSALQIVPDAFLQTVLGSLAFPETGGPRVLGVPLAMAGMWTIPLWVALFAAERLSGGSATRGAVWASALAGAVLVGSEAVLWAVPIWEAVGVATVAHVALYVVPAELVLGAVAYGAYDHSRGRGRGVQVALAVLVALVYTGGLAAAYLLVEA